MIAEADEEGAFIGQDTLADETLDEQVEEVLAELNTVEADAPKGSEIENAVEEVCLKKKQLLLLLKK